MSLDYLSAAAGLEAFLGDPCDERAPMNYRRQLEEDETEAFPGEALEALDRAADAAALGAARSAHTFPGRLSLVSSVVKAFEPQCLAGVMKRLAVLLGARHYVREGEYATFQKLARDLPVISLGHASTDVCLSLVAAQLRQLARVHGEGGPAEAEPERLEATFRLSRPLPALDFQALELSCQGRDPILRGLPALLDRVQEGDPGAGAMAGLGRLIVERHQGLMRAVPPELNGLPADHPAWFDAAGRYCRLQSAASVFYGWHYNREDQRERDGLGSGFVGGSPAAYDTLFERALGRCLGVEPKDARWVETALEDMGRCAESGLSAGMLRLPLASGGGSGEGGRQSGGAAGTS